MDRLNINTTIDLTIGKQSLGTLIAGKPIMAQQQSITLRVTMDEDVQALLMKAMNPEKEPGEDQAADVES